MARNTISLGEAFTPATVKIADREFETQDLNKKRQREFNDIQSKIAELDEFDDASNDEIVKLWGQQLDIILRPVGKGQQKKASTLIVESWDAGDLGSAALGRFVMDVYSEVSPFGG